MHVIRPPPPPTLSTPPLLDTFIYPHLEAISVNPPPIHPPCGRHERMFSKLIYIDTIKKNLLFLA